MRFVLLEAIGRAALRARHRPRQRSRASHCRCSAVIVYSSVPVMNLPRLSQNRKGLYDPRNEHDACGVGFVAHIKGKKVHTIVEQGLHDPATTSRTAARSAPTR